MLTENRQREDSFIQGGSAAGRCGTRNDSTKRRISGDLGIVIVSSNATRRSGEACGSRLPRNDSTKRGSSGDFGWHCHLEEQKADAAISVNADGARLPRSASLRSQ
jgi:hypothetical protein